MEVDLVPPFIFFALCRFRSSEYEFLGGWVGLGWLDGLAWLWRELVELLDFGVVAERI